ncbi:MAG: heavy metal translocating P-type ATPase [Rhodothermales bacterium]
MNDKLRIDLPIVLPDVPDRRDDCVRRLVELLEDYDGVERAHVLAATDDEPAKLCVHFDPDLVSLSHIRIAALRMGAQLTDHFGHVVWEVEGLYHRRRARTVAERLRRDPGVMEAEAGTHGPIRIEFVREKTDERTLRSVLREMNVRVVEKKPLEVRRVEEPGGAVEDEAERAIDHARQHELEHEDEGEHVHGGVFGEHTELIFAILSGVFVTTGWLLDTFTEVAGGVPFAGYLLAYFFGGYYTLREAMDSIRMGRFEIDFLMLVAAAGAAVLGEWAEGALLLFLFSLGHSLEHFAMGRARRAIEALAEMAPDTAVVRRNGREEEVSVEELRVGDVVVVRTNERIPADGLVVKGESAVNQAPVTGESVPVDKQPVDDPDAAAQNPEALAAEHRVFAGTINGSGALEIMVTKRSSESTLARVVKLIAEAETEKSPTQRFTDRFERVFVPAVLGLVVLLFFAWFVVDEPFSASFYRAMAVLVAASPCALAIATPSAVLSGVARAGRGGVLVKGGGPLENLGTLSAIAFDKTGTLTEGKPRVTDVQPYGSISEEDLLATTAAVEKLSDHPLARAVVRFAVERLEGSGSLPEAGDFESITGRGVRARMDGEAVYIGKDDLFEEVDGPRLPDDLLRSAVDLEENGRTTMIVRRGDQYLGVIGLMDTPRDAAAETLRRLRDLGIRRMVMISGDNQRVADAVARRVGLDEARGDLMPDDKVETIRSLRHEEKVAMVGDGVNDAPAMANATVGIAMGAAGSDVALETADVALMADRLEHLPFAVGLSRRTSRIIRQNLWISLGMVAFLVPATILGLGIGPAVAFHEGSTLVVVFNALRLLAYRV